MGTIAGANASHGFSDDVFGFFLRNGLAGGVHFSKILSQFVRYFQFPLMRDSDRLEGADADRFAFPYTASQKRFDSGLLVGREIFGIADHGMKPDYIMTDCILKLQDGLATQNLADSLADAFYDDHPRQLEEKGLI